MSHLIIEMLCKITKQNDVTNTRIGEISKQKKVIYKEFVILMTRASHLINNKIIEEILNKIGKQKNLKNKRLSKISKQNQLTDKECMTSIKRTSQLIRNLRGQ